MPIDWPDYNPPAKAPAAHHTTHQLGGTDQISLAGLTAPLHHLTHQKGGTDEIDVTGLTGSGTPTKTGVYATKTDSDQTIGSASETQIIFNTKVADDNAEYNSTTGTVTLKESGFYAIYVGLKVVCAVSADYDFRLSVICSSLYKIIDEIMWAGLIGTMYLKASGALYLAAGTTIIVKLNQVSGQNVVVHAESEYTHFTVAKI